MRLINLISIFLFIILFSTFSYSQSSSIYEYDAVRLVEEEKLPQQLGEYLYLKVTLKDIDNFDIHAVVLNDNYHAYLYQQENENQLFAKSLRELNQKEDFIIGINGGFYTKDYKPAGLFVYKDKKISHASRKTLLASCVGINKNGKMSLQTSLTQCEHNYYALQGGPILINQGRVNSQYESLRKKYPSLQSFFIARPRTIIAESSEGKIIVIVTSSVTLLDMAKFLKKFPNQFGVKKIIKAWTLDGGSSSGMYIKFSNRPFYFPELRSVKTLIFFK